MTFELLVTIFAIAFIAAAVIAAIYIKALFVSTNMNYDDTNTQIESFAVAKLTNTASCSQMLNSSTPDLFRLLVLLGVTAGTPDNLADKVFGALDQSNILGIDYTKSVHQVLEGNKIKTLWCFTTDKDNYFLFLGTKLTETFALEAFTRGVKESKNGVRCLTSFTTLYDNYRTNIIKFFKKYGTDTTKKNYIIGHSLGAVLLHMAMVDLDGVVSFEAAYTIGCPRVFSTTSKNWKSIVDNNVINYQHAGDVIPIFYEPIINNEIIMIPGSIQGLNVNSGSYVLNHHPLLYFQSIYNLLLNES